MCSTPLRYKLILVEPKYQINLGYIARVAMNFGVKRIYAVRPRARLTGKDAIKYAKHAHAMLEQAKVYGSFDEAVRNCGMVIGTTGIAGKAKANFRRIDFAERLVGRLGGMKSNATVALVLGRDDTGLTSEEMEKCDAVAYIPTSPRYPVLNISHALAILLYLLNREGIESSGVAGMEKEGADESEMRALLNAFDALMVNKRVRNKRAVSGVFERLVRNAQPSRSELHALITAVKQQ